jgi:hypothetical protein
MPLRLPDAIERPPNPSQGRLDHAEMHFPTARLDGSTWLLRARQFARFMELGT